MPPDLVLALLLGSIYGTLFHLWRGKTIRDLLIYFPSGIIGFGLGQMVGTLLGLNFMLIGPIHVFEATLISWISLFIIQWLKV